MFLFSNYDKHRIVKAIEEGLENTKENYYSTDVYVKNSIHFRKLDDIMNSVIKETLEASYFERIAIKRGSYEVTLLFDNRTGYLYSFFTERRFKELMIASDRDHVHYFDGLVKFNEKDIVKLGQQTMGDYFDVRVTATQLIKEEILAKLNHRDVKKCISIVMNVSGLSLFGASAIVINDDYTISYSEDWGDFVNVTYSDAYENIEVESEKDEVDFGFKDEIDILDEQIKIRIKDIDQGQRAIDG